MKAIILLSSIFYILGLKIGHKIDVFRTANPVQKITTTTNAVKSAAKSVYFSEEVKKVPVVDSLKQENSVNRKTEEKKHF
jgi:hypothetical protein